jgi:hypothetical protein
MMSGKPQTLLSKFKISYSLLLSLIQSGETNFMNFANKSMVTNDLDKEKGMLYMKIQNLDLQGKNVHILERTPGSILSRYNEILNNKHTYSNKKRKEAERQIQQWKDEYRYLEQDQLTFTNCLVNELKNTSEKNALQTQMANLDNYVQNQVNKVMHILEHRGFLLKPTLTLSLKGELATNIKEIHGLVFAGLIEEKKLDVLSAKELVALFSCFTNIHVSDDFKTISLRDREQKEEKIVLLLEEINKSHQEYNDLELQNNINTGFDYLKAIQYDLIEYVLDWCEAETIDSCKQVLQNMAEEKEIFLGEFVKALLKINNISNEMEKNAERIGNLDLLSKLREIPVLTLKFVVTNQSLYV